VTVDSIIGMLWCLRGSNFFPQELNRFSRCPWSWKVYASRYYHKHKAVVRRPYRGSFTDVHFFSSRKLSRFSQSELDLDSLIGLASFRRRGSSNFL
jgi:hypothetical protein